MCSCAWVAVHLVQADCVSLVLRCVGGWGLWGGAVRAPSMYVVRRLLSPAGQCVGELEAQ